MDDTLAKLITTLKKYDPYVVEDVYSKLKYENFEYENFAELLTKVNELISRELEQYAEKKIDYKQYEMREELLSKYPRIDAHDAYRYVFPENSLQACDELDSENGIGNAIRMDIVEKWSTNEDGRKQCERIGIQSVITEDLRFLFVKPKKVQDANIILTNLNLNSYFGNRRLRSNIDLIFGLIIDVDGVVKESQMLHVLDDIENERIPVPNFLINSGHGLHFYYVFDEPIHFHERSFAVYPVITNILNAITNLIWTPATSDIKPEVMDINKGYTVIGTKNRKNSDLIVTAYFVNPDKCSLQYLRSFINKPDDDADYDISFPPRTKVTKEEAKQLYPRWAVKKFPEEFEEEERQRLLKEIELEKKTHKKSMWISGRNISVCNTAVYYWFLNLISDPQNLRHGNRYNCMFGLAIYGVKCGMDKGVVEKDLKKLLPLFNSVSKREDDTHFWMNETDIKNALHAYKSKYSHRYTFEWIMKLTGIEYEPKTKRREHPLPQKEHLALARQNCEELHPNGSWRGNSDGSAKQKIIDFMKNNPDAYIDKCIEYCGASRQTVYKYWDECRIELGLSPQKRISNAEKIKSYRQDNPDARKVDCIRDLGLSKQTVYTYWDS